MGQKPRAKSGTISTAGACQLLMLSRQRLDQLVQEGWIQRHVPGRWVSIDLVQGYIRFMRDEARRTSKSAAGSRVHDARAREIEIRVAEQIGKLVVVEEFDAMVDGIVGTFRAELSGLPARVTRDIVQRRSIEREIHGLLERVADTAAAISDRLEKGCASDATIAADVARSLGDVKPNLSAIGPDTGAA